MSTFSVEDIRLLEKTISIRERLIDNVIGQAQLPTAAKDLEAVTNLLESVDRSIFSKAKINIDEASNKINEQTNGVLKNLLLQFHKTPVMKEVTSTEPPVFQSTGLTLNEGELIKHDDAQDINQFLEQVKQ